MLQDRATRRRVVAFAVLVATSLLLLAMSGTSQLQDLRRGVNFALAPIQETLAQGARSVAGIFAAVGEIDQLRQENRELRARVDALVDEIAGLDAVRAENQRLSRLLDTRGSLDRKTVAAQVVARQSTQFERVVTLDRGEEAGIEVGDAVLSEGGALAGSVVEVGRDYASVRLLNDTRSLVIGMDVSTRATGEVVGKLSAPLAMGNVPATDRLRVNDRIVTAGLDLGKGFRSFYPRGLLIGSVVDVINDTGAIIQTALVEPAADLDRLEWVLIITDYKPPRIPGTEATPAPEEAETSPAPDEEAVSAERTPRPTREPEATRRPRRTAVPAP